MAKVDDKEYKAHGLLDQLEKTKLKWEDILGIYQGRNCGKSAAILTALEENEKRLREIAGLSAPKLELPKVETYIKPDGTRVKHAIPPVYPYVPTYLPLLDESPEKAFLFFGPDLAEDPDRLNIQIKRKHNKLKFNFNN